MTTIGTLMLSNARMSWEDNSVPRMISPLLDELLRWLTKSWICPAEM